MTLTSDLLELKDKKRKLKVKRDDERRRIEKKEPKEISEKIIEKDSKQKRMIKKERK